jgi:flagella basal body P-ring formation protein FlgA
MAEGWQDRIVFEASASPYSTGFRRSLTFQNLPAGTMQLEYRIVAPELANSAVVGGTLRLWVHHFLPVARAAVDLTANWEMSQDVLTFSEEDVSLSRSTFVLRGEEISGYRILASIRRGERIEVEKLQRVPAIRAGDKVTINFVRPGLLISLPGRALRSGAIGELIDVRPDAANRRLRARISARGEVFVESD